MKIVQMRDGTLSSPGGAGSMNLMFRGFHSVRGGINPGGHRFRSQFVGVEDV